MTPRVRKILYAVLFETLGILVAAAGLMGLAGSGGAESLGLSVLSATIALGWSYAFNSGFEAWEARQTRKGRSFARRFAHAVLFEVGLTLILLPVMAWWLDLTLWGALKVEAGIIALFLIYTWVFTWAFDRLFGLPRSAR